MAAEPQAAPAWFHDLVIGGVQLLVTLALPGTPPAETMPLTATSWVTVLFDHGRWDEATDVTRLQAAFTVLGRSIERWPAPRQLLDHLPPRTQVQALPPPPISRETARARAAEWSARRSAFEEGVKARAAEIARCAARAAADTGQARADDEALLAQARGWFKDVQLPGAGQRPA